LVLALAKVHVELILIYPFREGNGRTARLLSDLMALQAGYSPLNYITIDQTIPQNIYNKYIEAIHAGVDCNYEPIKKIFELSINQSFEI